MDRIIYINLDKRTDRREHIESEFKRVNIPLEKVERFSAIEHEYSPTGCNLSHAAVLKLAKERGYKNVLILEDDFTFIDDVKKIHSTLNSFFETVKEWDVLNIGCIPDVSEQYNDSFGIVLKTSNACGYLVNSHMFDALSSEFESSAELLFKTHQHWNYQNDVVWNKFTNTKKWFYTIPRLGYQFPCYSDLSKCFVDHR